MTRVGGRIRGGHLRGRGALLLLLVAGGAGVARASPAAAQLPVEWDAAREQMTRAELEQLLVTLQENAASTAYSARTREQLERSLETVRKRLQEGDFQVGDRIVLEVERESELSDTLTVRSGGVVTIPVVGDVSVQGILRSELQEHLEDHLRRFVREPRVRAQPLIRISVVGEIAAPGFYLVPADMLVTDVLMRAGGPTGAASLTEMRIERGAQRIWEGTYLEEAVIQGRTLDQLNLQAGDRIVLPTEVRRSGWDVFQVVAATTGALLAVVFGLSQLF
jgi:polysaccharide biosynthesis/export protein